MRPAQKRLSAVLTLVLGACVDPSLAPDPRLAHGESQASNESTGSVASAVDASTNDPTSADASVENLATQPATTPNLASAERFAVLAGDQFRRSDTTRVDGAVGVSSPDDTTDAGTSGDVPRALRDAVDAALRMNSAPCNLVLHDAELGTRLLGQGVICLEGQTRMNADLVLDAQGNDLAVFVLRVAGTLTVAPGATVRLRSCAEARGVFWSVADDIVLGADSHVLGSFLAGGDITLGPGAQLHGRAFAPNGSVVANGASIGNVGL